MGFPMIYHRDDIYRKKNEVETICTTNRGIIKRLDQYGPIWDLHMF